MVQLSCFDNEYRYLNRLSLAFHIKNHLNIVFIVESRRAQIQSHHPRQLKTHKRIVLSVIDPTKRHFVHNSNRFDAFLDIQLKQRTSLSAHAQRLPSLDPSNSLKHSRGKNRQRSAATQ